MCSTPHFSGRPVAHTPQSLPRYQESNFSFWEKQRDGLLRYREERLERLLALKDLEEEVKNQTQRKRIKRRRSPEIHLWKPLLFGSFVVFCGLLILGPLEAKTLNGFSLDDALIPVEDILVGGPPRDGIPSIDDPKFISADDAGFLQSNDRVLGIEIGKQIRAYPIKILNWHEIVNDQIGSTPFVITFCPLCGTGIAFSAQVNGIRREFGVSGLLYNSDVLLYDRQSDSLWSQIMGQSVSGEEKGEELNLLPLTHTSWKAWKQQHPNTRVLSTETGYFRDYEKNPYRGYEKSRSVYFKVNNRPPKGYHPKEQVLGVRVGGSVMAYPFIELNRQGKRQFKQTLGGEDLTIYWDEAGQSGRVVGSDGRTLPSTQAFWFAWFAFYPETVIFKFIP